MAIAVSGVIVVWVGFVFLGAWIFMLLWGALVGMFGLDFFTPSFWQAFLISGALSVVRSLLFGK